MKIKITGRSLGEFTSTSSNIPLSSFGRDGEIPFALAQYFTPQYTQQGVGRYLMSLIPAPLTQCLEEHLREEELEQKRWEKENSGLPRLSIDSNVVDPETRATLTKDFISLDFSQATRIFDNLGTFVLIPAIFSIPSLISLDLFGSKLGTPGSALLADGLKHSNVLRYLKIAYDDMGQDGQRELSQGLVANRSLTTLDLSNEVLVDAEDLISLFNLNLPDLSVAEKIVNPISCGENNYFYTGDILACVDLHKKYINNSTVLLRTIEQHSTIKHFCFGVISDSDFFTFLNSRMLKVKGLVLQSTFPVSEDPEVSSQLLYLTSFKDRVGQVNDKMVNVVISIVQELAATPEVCLPQIAKYIGFVNLMASAHDNPIRLPVEVQEFIGNNYLSLLLLTLRKNQGNSLLDTLPADMHKNVASYIFNFQLGEDVVEYRAQPHSEERAIMGGEEGQYGDDFL